jgi:predicted nucleic acid-binding protein
VKTYVLDASALLRYFQLEPGADRVERLLEDSRRGYVTLLMSVVNLGEVFYRIWQDLDEIAARKTLAGITQLPLLPTAVDLEQSLKAGEIKVRHKIPYVDCIAASLTTLRNATLVTSDDDFAKLGRNFPILWLS